MRKTTNILAILAAGAIGLTATTASALVSVGISDTVDGQRIAVPVTLLPNNHTVANLGGHTGSRRYFRITVPAGQAYLTIVTEGGYGDVDLYMAYRHVPSPTDHEFASAEEGSAEQITILNPAPGNWLILVHGYEAYSGLSLLTSTWQQEVHYATPVHPLSSRVVIDWDYGHRRPLGGLIPYILRRIGGRQWVRHDAWHASSHRRPHVMVRPPEVRIGTGYGRAQGHRGQPAVTKVPPIVTRTRPTVGSAPRVVTPRVSSPRVIPSVRTNTGRARPSTTVRPQATVRAPVAAPRPTVTAPQRTATAKPAVSRPTSRARTTAAPTASPRRSTTSTRTAPRVSPQSSSSSRPTATARPTQRSTAPRTTTATSTRDRLLSTLRSRVGRGSR